MGFSLFMFGKKQQRLPQLVAGMLMMASPLFIRDPIWVSVTAVAMLIGMRVAIQHEA